MSSNAAAKSGKPTGLVSQLISWIQYFFWDHASLKYLIPLILLAELILGLLIIRFVNYTEIDWIAYMQEVGGVLSGEMDYANLRGDTGPLVYPAGFVYIYSVLYWVTGEGKNVLLGQYIFLAIYIVFMYVVLKIYQATRLVPPWAMVLLSASHRIHSIFMLRLFNDCIAMLFLYIAVWLLIKDKWTWASIMFSLGVSVKMNILLFGPSIFILYLKRLGFFGAVKQCFVLLFVQIAVGLPFLLTFPKSYLVGSFNFGRAFFYKWTVNLKFLPEEIFLDKRVATTLLIVHVTLLVLFLNRMEQGGLFNIVKRSFSLTYSPTAKKKHDNDNQVDTQWNQAIVTIMFVGNFIGIVFSRSLHYQFYVWYFHTIVYLLFLLPSSVHPLLAVVLVFAIEYCWNVYPAQPHSSALLWTCHLFILIGLAISFGSKKNLLCIQNKNRDI